MTRTFRFAIPLVLVLGIIGLFTPPAAAQPGGHPFISAVHADFDLFRLRIVGDNFGTAPSVWLGDRQLDVESATNTEIYALLGGPIDPGSYLVTVGRDENSKGTAKYLHSSFDATLGAQGPKGDKGDKGDQGEQGNPGQDGQDGEDGLDGQNGASPFVLAGNDAVYTNGNLGVGTAAPTALIQAGPGQQYGNVTTFGASQRPQDTVGVSVRSDFMRPTFQFCASGPCNYIQMDRASTDLWFGDFNNPSMIVQAPVKGGNVGVGVRVPTAHLQVGDPAGFPNHFGNATTLGVFQEFGDTVGLSIRRGNGNPIQQFCDFQDCNYIEMQAGSRDLMFGTNGNSAGPTMSVRRLLQGGGVGIHMPPQNGIALAVNGASQFNGPSTTVNGPSTFNGFVQVNNQMQVFGSLFATQFIATSSRRFKTDIETLTGALDLVARMRGVTYTARATGKAEVGVIAEEMYDVLPQIVGVTDGQVQGVDYSRLVAVLIEAVKEQQEQIKSLRQEMTSLAAALAAAQQQ